MGKKVEFVMVTVTDIPATAETPPQQRLVGVDTAGRVWERLGDMPMGRWGLVEPPDEPEPTHE